MTTTTPLPAAMMITMGIIITATTTIVSLIYRAQQILMFINFFLAIVVDGYSKAVAAVGARMHAFQCPCTYLSLHFQCLFYTQKPTMPTTG